MKEKIDLKGNHRNNDDHGGIDSSVNDLRADSIRVDGPIGNNSRVAEFNKWGYVLSQQKTIMKIVATSKSLFPSQDHSEMEIVFLKQQQFSLLSEANSTHSHYYYLICTMIFTVIHQSHLGLLISILGVRNILHCQEGFLINRNKLISQSWIKESTPILFQMKDIVQKVTLEPFGVAHLHLRSQERPPLSGRVPDKQKQADISKLDKGINPNPFPNEIYSLGGPFRTILGYSSPSQESGTSSSVRKGS